MIVTVQSDHKFCKKVHEAVNVILGKEVPNLAQLHTEVSSSEVNELRLQLFRLLNEDYDQNAALLSKPILGRLVNLLGPDLAIQTQINVSIHLPGDASSTLDAHSDTWSGETPFQLNLWLAASDCASTNSMFVLNEEETRRFYKDMDVQGKCPSIEKLAARRFIKLSSGEGVLFNPHLIHGNTTNDTAFTRVSCNIRFKGLFHPESSDSGLAIRARGNFFRPLTITENSVYALSVLGISHQAPILGNDHVA